jgi:hypothetical protein
MIVKGLLEGLQPRGEGSIILVLLCCVVVVVLLFLLLLPPPVLAPLLLLVVEAAGPTLTQDEDMENQQKKIAIGRHKDRYISD